MADEHDTIDDYQLLNCIASGSTTQIWEVVREGGSDHLAMKVLLPEAMKESANKQVLKHEAKVHKSLDHPCFVRFHTIVVNRQNAYLLMDYFRAANIKSQLMTDLSGLQARLRKIVESLCLGLGYMHQQGWVHKDIKPENVLCTKASEVRIIDFSLSTRYSSGLGKLFVGKSSVIQGTRTYIAPETIQKQAVSPQTDMYSLGVMLFEILAGQPPFTGSSPNELLIRHIKEKPPAPSHYNKNVTPEADAVIARLLEKKPAKRFQDMNEIYSEFRSLKIFKEDPLELATTRKANEHAMSMDGLDEATRLDSRADHLRSQSGTPRESTKPKPKPKPKPAPPAKSAAPGKKPGAPARPQAPSGGQPPRQPAPPGPGMPHPQQPFPQHAFPQSGFPQQGQPHPGFPPGYPQPGGPMPYPQPLPGMPYPPGYAVAGGPGMPPQGMQGQPGMFPPGMPPQPGMPGYGFPAGGPQAPPQQHPQQYPQQQYPQPSQQPPAGAPGPQPGVPGPAIQPGSGQPPAPQGAPRSAEEANRALQHQAKLAQQRAAAQDAAGAALRAPSQIPSEDRHLSQKNVDADLPLMDELPDIL